MVGIDEFSVEGHALVLAQNPRHGIHVDHDLNMVGGAWFPCLGVVDGAVLARHRDEIRLAAQGSGVALQGKRVLVLHEDAVAFSL